MRLITLNCWGGRSLYPLMSFFRVWKDHVDVFCLQEMFDADQRVLDERYPNEYLRGDLFRLIAAELTEFDGFFARFDEDPNEMALATFVRKSLPLVEVTDRTVYVPAEPMNDGHVVISSRKLQTARLRDGQGDRWVNNFHGIWVNGPKTDTPERLAVSDLLVGVLEGQPGRKTLCGDLNLLSDTKSLQRIVQGAKLRNPVVERGIASTRTPLYRHYHNPDEPNFADYLLHSKDQELEEFSVPDEIVSDHRPLYGRFA